MPRPAGYTATANVKCQKESSAAGAADHGTPSRSSVPRDGLPAKSLTPATRVC